jgi:3'-phosphoadenosine 5'-phosphosulfate sulfotransferase (PAPS reductase)/FAD synthetase
MKKIRIEGHPKWGRQSRISKKWQYLIDAPFKISDFCCDIMKKNPFKRFEKDTGLEPYLGLMASDNRMRKMSYLRLGCNSFEGWTQSNPLGFWLEEDVWDYIKTFNVPYSPIYDIGYNNTGCMFCMFGIHLEDEPNRFQKMKLTHPKIYSYCMNKLGIKEVLEYINVKYE